MAHRAIRFQKLTRLLRRGTALARWLLFSELKANMPRAVTSAVQRRATHRDV